MGRNDKIKKMETLPWQALFDVAIQKGIDRKEVNNKEKAVIIQLLLSIGQLSDEEIDELVNDYIYGDRVSFTLWTFQSTLNEGDYVLLQDLKNLEQNNLSVVGFRNLKILSTEVFMNRLEIVYVYSKEYTYIDESGHNASIWEQHRGCVWIGMDATYLACISKHEKMTVFITQFIGEKLSKTITHIRPPKSAIDKCIKIKAISRIVLQGKEGEKTIVSRAGGLTFDQEDEVARIKSERIDTSGSYIAEIAEDLSATVKYNRKNGSMGIYKHLPASVLFEWTENAIVIILDEIEALKGKPAEEIFREVGLEIKWNNMSSKEESQLNWYLTQIITSMGKDDYEIQIPKDKLEILDKKKMFIKLPRIYCQQCDSYEIPYCTNCGEVLEFDGSQIKACNCGAPLKIQCSQGHQTYEMIYWYVSTSGFTDMANRNIRKIYKDYKLNYSLCIIGDMLHISWGERVCGENEIFFDEVECFKNDLIDIPDNIRKFAVRLQEKCNCKIKCTNENINTCIKSKKMLCLPKVFYSVLPGYRPHPHNGFEYGDVAGEIKVNGKGYEMKGIIKKHTVLGTGEKELNMKNIETKLLSTSKGGEEIIRQFVEQGMNDAKCEVIAVIVPQYIDDRFKGTLRYLARLSRKKVMFVELDEMCKLMSVNAWVEVS